MDCTAIRGRIAYLQAYFKAFRHTHGILDILPAGDVIRKDPFELKDATTSRLPNSDGCSLIGDVAVAIVVIARAKPEKRKRQN
ncbi:MAG: hypothetical protein ACRENW_07200 [Thermodesulfobacteriota bacterium]